MWGLLISALSVLKSKKDTDELIESFVKNNPPFVISSLFPFSINYENEIIHYLPRPIVCNFDYEVTDALLMTYFKDFKKIKFVNRNVFQEIIKGEIDDKILFTNFIEFKGLRNKESELRKKGKKLSDEEKEKLRNYLHYFSEPLIRAEQVLHNTIDRMSCSTLETEEGGQLYTTDDYYLYQNFKKESEIDDKDKKIEIRKSGLYFLIEGDIKIIEVALRFLSHFGFGGNNTTGKGNFRFEIKDFELELPDNPNSFVTLSLFHPTQEQRIEILREENKNKLWYELEFRSGRIGVHFADEPNKNQKNIVANFTEGSTFPYIEDKCLGQLIKTADTKLHPVYNNGFCFKIPSNLKY